MGGGTCRLVSRSRDWASHAPHSGDRGRRLTRIRREGVESRGRPLSPTHAFFFCLKKFFSRCSAFTRRRRFWHDVLSFYGRTLLPIASLSQLEIHIFSFCLSASTTIVAAHLLATLWPIVDVESNESAAIYVAIEKEKRTIGTR